MSHTQKVLSQSSYYDFIKMKYCELHKILFHRIFLQGEIFHFFKISFFSVKKLA